MRLIVLAIAAIAAAPLAAAAPDGAALFGKSCSGCHQSKGEGIPGAFPALAGDKLVTGDPAAVAAILLNGKGGMPSFRNGLTDDQLAAIASYVRSSWGNNAPPIPAAAFAKLRAGTPAAPSQ